MDYQLGPGPLQVDQNTIDEKIKGDIGIVENGDVATHAIPSGYYVIWKGDLYVAKTDISSGTTLSTSNLTAKPNGLGAEVAALNSKIATSYNVSASYNTDVISSPTIRYQKFGKVVVVSLDFTLSTDVSTNTDLITGLPETGSPVWLSLAGLNDGKAYRLRVNGTTISTYYSHTLPAQSYNGFVVYIEK